MTSPGKAVQIDRQSNYSANRKRKSASILTVVDAGSLDIRSCNNRRLELLPSYGVFGTPPERDYDQLAELTAELLDAPICLISFIGEHHQWVKARVGLDIESVPLDVSFCVHTIQSPDPLIVLDALADTRFAGNPLVKNEPCIRFYAGAPIAAVDGTRLGTVCVIDNKPRSFFEDHEKRCLARMAEMVSHRLEATQRAHMEKAATSFSDAVGLAVITSDMQGNMTYWNPAAEHIFGWSLDAVIGQSMGMIMPERFRAAHDAGLKRLRDGGKPRLSGKTVEVVARHADGHEFPIELSLSVWMGPRGLEVGAHIQDLTERRKREHILEGLARNDALTGLLNARNFSFAIRDRLTECGSAALLSIDLDGFKRINDTLGHAIGDALLQSVALRLASIADGDCIVGRLGGDEFGILLAENTDLFGARDAGASVLAVLSEVFYVDDHRLQLAASVGIAFAPDHARNAEELLARADLAMFKAKEAGGSAYRLFDSTMARQIEARKVFKEELRKANGEMQWRLDYQPQVCMINRTLDGVEALLRWQHPRLGLLQPAAFMPILETHLVAYEVGLWVLNESCRQLAAWRAAGQKIRQVSVNLFAAQIGSPALVTDVLDALERHQLAPSDLELEITEKIVLGNEQALVPLGELMRQGVSVSLDDFGTGYASLSTLKLFPPSRLKIDRSFVQDIEHDAHSAAVVFAVLAIAKQLCIDVVAEGVETFEQERRLLELGCRIGQGFRYGKTFKPSPKLRQVAPL